MPNNGMANVDLTGDGNALPPEVAAAVANAGPGAGPESEVLLQDLEQDEQPAEGNAQQADDSDDADDGTPAQVPESVPYKQFARTYAEGAEAKKTAAQLRKENEQLKARLNQPAPQQPQGQPAQGKPNGLQVIAKVAAQAAREAVAPLEIQGKVNDAKEMLDEFWAEQPDEVRVHRKQVDKAVIQGIKTGAYTLDELNPEILLAVHVGQNVLTSQKAARAASAASAKKVAAANKGAHAENGHRAAASGGKGNKKFSEMTTKEIEEQWGDAPVYRSRLLPEDEE